jgi:HEXXH motif-containing protein
MVRKLRLLALRRLLVASPAEAGPGQRSLGRVQEVIAEAARAHKSALLDALGEVDVLTPLLCLVAGQGSPPKLLCDAIPALLIALAERGALDTGVVWEAPIGRVRDGQAGRFWMSESPATALYADRGVVELQLEDGSRRELSTLEAEARLFSLRPGLELSLVDSNPLSHVEQHPDKKGNSIDLGEHAPEDWVAALSDALDLVKQVLPGWEAELPHALRRVIPVGFEPEMHLSASYREAPGLCYLTLHPSCLTLAEALVHETQHGKINVLSFLDPVLHNAFSEWSPSPVRPDLRPIWGVLLAVHAFVPVSVMHALMAESGHPLSEGIDFASRRAEVLQGNLHGMRILEEKSRPSAMGDRLLRDMRKALNALREVHSDPLPDSEQLPPG